MDIIILLSLREKSGNTISLIFKNFAYRQKAVIVHKSQLVSLIGNRPKYIKVYKDDGWQSNRLFARELVISNK